MRPSLLLRYDDASWSADRRYDADVARALWMCYRVLGIISPPVAEPLDAYAMLARWIDAPLCPQQRIRVYYVFARSYEEENDSKAAIAKIDDALYVAAKAHLFGEMIELLAYQGRLQRMRLQFGAAAENLHGSLALMYRHAKSAETIDPNWQLELLAQLITYSFYLEQYRPAIRLIRQARLLFQDTPTLSLEAASVIWVQAHLERIRGFPDRALGPALQVAENHAREASLASQDRIETFVAEIALDLAERYPTGPAAINRTPMLLLAQGHRRQSERLCRACNDSEGLFLNKLTRARESRLRGRNQDRVAEIQRVIRAAHRIADVALLAQALTAMGDELAARGETESAMRCYRDTLDALKGSQVPALGVKARRALLLASEQLH